MRPVTGGWLRRDDAYAAQLAEKARLIGWSRDKVTAILPEARESVDELCDVVLAELGVDGDRSDPWLTLSSLVQEDLCILQKQGDEHRMTAALLCFPAAWTLAEKLGRPLTGIHAPVAPYDDQIALRVQRMFDGVQVGRPMMRANLLRYDRPDLFQPHTETAPRPVGRPDSPYERSERQCVLRLPRTNAVVFSIHTTVVLRQG